MSIFVCLLKMSRFDLLCPSSSYTFTDLAQIVCRIPETYPDHRYSSSDDEYFDGYISEPSTLHMKPKNMFRMKRTGGSLSLSENEIDSDELEIPVPFNLSEKTRERLNSASKSNKTKEEEQELLKAVANSSGGSQNASPNRGAVKVVEGSEADEAKEQGSSEKKKETGSPAKSTEDYVEFVK